MARFGGQVAVARATIPPVTRGFSLEPAVLANFDRSARSSSKLRDARHPPEPRLHRRRVRPPVGPRRLRHLPDPAEVPRSKQHDPDKRPWVERLLEPARIRRPVRDEVVGDPPEPAKPGRALAAGDVRLPRLGPAGDRREHAVRPLRRRDPDRPGATPSVNPPVVWYRQASTIEEQVDDTAQLFLGMRIQCARCHHHPFERGARTTITASPRSSAGSAASRATTRSRPGSSSLPGGRRRDPVTGEARKPTVAGRTRADGPRPPPRPAASAGRLAPPARQPVLRPGPGQPLLEALPGPRAGRARGRHAGEQPAVQPRAARRPGRRLRRARLRPQASWSGRSRRAAPTTGRACRTPRTRDDRQNFARFYPRRLAGRGAARRDRDRDGHARGVRRPAEVVPGRSSSRTRASTRRSVPRRLRPPETRERLRVRTVLRGEPVAEPPPAELDRNRAQAWRPGGRAARWAVDPRPDAEKIDELYRIGYSSAPDREEREVCLAHLARRQEEGRLQAGLRKTCSGPC